MALRIKNLLNYLTLAYSFYNVLAISPCDLRTIPLKLQSRDAFSAEVKSATNRPSFEESVSTTVNFSLSINELNVLDIKNLDVEIDLGMTQKWYDHRLGPDYKTRKLAVLGAIWQPKITFVVGNKCSADLITTGNDQTQFWRGTSNGSVFYSERLFFAQGFCQTEMYEGPNEIPVRLADLFSENWILFTADEVSLQWSSEEPVDSRVGKELGEFRIDKFNTYDEVDVRSAGNFSVLVLEIRLSRYSRREVIQSFIPSVILVKMSYAVFWMKLSAVRMRIFTCQFSLVGMLFLFTNSNCGVSNSTYLKALDIWFLICLVFVLLPLTESVLIHHFDCIEENFDCIETEFETEFEIKPAKKIAVRIDKIISLLHPIGLLSCIILFITVFNVGKDTID